MFVPTNAQLATAMSIQAHTDYPMHAQADVVKTVVQGLHSLVELPGYMDIVAAVADYTSGAKTVAQTFLAIQVPMGIDDADPDVWQATMSVREREVRDALTAKWEEFNAIPLTKS